MQRTFWHDQEYHRRARRASSCRPVPHRNRETAPHGVPSCSPGRAGSLDLTEIPESQRGRANKRELRVALSPDFGEALDDKKRHALLFDDILDRAKKSAASAAAAASAHTAAAAPTAPVYTAPAAAAYTAPATAAAAAAPTAPAYTAPAAAAAYTAPATAAAAAAPTAPAYTAPAPATSALSTTRYSITTSPTSISSLPTILPREAEHCLSKQHCSGGRNLAGSRQAVQHPP
eukprot:TRINITY_DN1305_c0_g1_i6.p3 TRINITY_DN1305_c0_g1~~TRINITY_DN1305_c0_g1_i6.p3  ORF type:complete len:232 (+),score=53.98 TRINITY_DN1305_c0_g1_i6:798-1493(+)